MLKFDDLYSPISFGGGGAGAGEGPSAMEAITGKMDRDNASTSQGYHNAIGGDRAMTEIQTRQHVAYQINSDVNGWPSRRTGNIGGCTGCHQGRFDTHYPGR